MLSKKQKKSIIIFLAQSIGLWILKLFYLTYKKSNNGVKIPNEPCLLVTWHGEMGLMPFFFTEQNKNNKQVKVIASPHGDGQIIAKIIKKFPNADIIYGSSNKNPTKTLLSAFKSLKNKNDIAIALDGPRGPRHSVANGVVALSQKLNTPIVTFNCKCENFWQFKSWDKMCLPKPFSKVHFFIGEPFFVENLSLEEAKQKIQNKLLLNSQP